MKNFPIFEPAWWLNHPHLQTIWTEILRPSVDLPLFYERFELFDSDFVDLVWSQKRFKQTAIVLHGLGGSSSSPYMRGMMRALNRINFNTVAVLFRGCSEEPNRRPKMFHGGMTTDLAKSFRA